MPRGQSDGDVVIDVLLDDKSAIKYWNSFSSYMEMSTKQLEKKLNESARKISDFQNKYTEINQKLKDVRTQKFSLQIDKEAFDEAVRKIFVLDGKIQKVRQQLERANWTTGGEGYANEEEKQKINALQEQLNVLKNQRTEVIGYKKELQSTAEAYVQLQSQENQLKQERKDTYNVLKEESNTFNEMNQQYNRMRQNNNEIKDKATQIEHHTNNIGKNVKKINGDLRSGVNHLSQGIKKIIRMGLALVGIRSIYTGISSVLRTWMNSEDQLAKQTKANLENLKANIGSMLQPALQWVIGAFNNILGLVGAIVKQFTKLNIFANKTASSTSKMSKSASDTLASFDKIDVLKQDTSSDGGEGTVEPIDLTSYIEKYERLAEEIKGILETIFDPIKKAWDEKGDSVIKSIKTSFESLQGLGSSIGSSIFEVWTNGTGQKTAEYILGIFENVVKTIGNIASAWDEAWKKDDKGTKIVQNVADILNSILDVIYTITGFFEKLTASEGYKKFIDTLTEGLEVASGIVKFITETWSKMFDEKSPKWAENFGKIFGNIADTIQPVIDLIRGIWEDEKFQEFYKGFVDTIGQLVTVLTDWWVILSDILALIVNPDWEHLKTLGEDFKTFGKDVWQAGEDTAQTGSTFVEVLKKISEERLKSNPVQVATNVGAAGGIAPNFSSYMTTGSLLGGLENKEEIGKTVKGFFNTLGTKFKVGFGVFTQEVGTKVKLATGEIETKFGILKETLPRVIETAKEEIKTKFELMKGEVGLKVEAIKTTLTTKWELIKTETTTKVEGIKSVVTDKFNGIKTGIETTINNVKSTLGTKWDEIKSTVGEKAEGARNTIVEKFDPLKEKIKEKIENVKIGMGEKWDEIKRTIGEKVDPVAEKIRKPFENIGVSISSALDTAWWNIKNALNTIIEGVERMINHVSDGLNDFTQNKIGKALTTGALGGILSRFGVNINPGGTNFRHVSLPRLAQGGIVTQAVPAIIGEAGREAVLPLEQNTEWMDSLADKISAGLNVGINFTGSLSQLAQILKPEIDRENRRVGESLVKGGVM